MRCPECQTALPDSAKFCNECGTKLEFQFPECAKTTPPDSKLCPKYCHKLSIPSEPVPREPAVDKKIAKIQKHLCTGLAEKILSQRDKIDGEPKQVTPTLCHMTDFTPLVEKLGPEEAYSMMDRAYEILIHKVQATKKWSANLGTTKSLAMPAHL